MGGSTSSRSLPDSENWLRWYFSGKLSCSGFYIDFQVGETQFYKVEHVNMYGCELNKSTKSSVHHSVTERTLHRHSYCDALLTVLLLLPALPNDHKNWFSLALYCITACIKIHKKLLWFTKYTLSPDWTTQQLNKIRILDPQNCVPKIERV